MKLEDQPAQLPSESSAAEELENISRRIASMVSQREWDHPDWCYVAENYKCHGKVAFLDEESTPTTFTRDDYIANYRKFMDAHPDSEVAVDRVDVQVDEERGIARTWTVFVITGQPLNIRKELISQFHWVKRGGRWIAISQKGIRGAPNF